MEIIIAAALSIVLAWTTVTVIRNHAPSMFAGRVAGALYDLGVNVKKLDPVLSKKLEIECRAYYGATKKRANYRLLAVRFFVFACTEYENFPVHAIMRDAPLVTAISILREWAKKGYLPEEFAGREIDKIKQYLVSELPSQGMATDDRLAMEIQILEL